MYKSAVIISGLLWVLCTMYLGLARLYDFPYKTYAMAGCWIASALLLVCIIIFIKKHKKAIKADNAEK